MKPGKKTRTMDEPGKEESKEKPEKKEDKEVDDNEDNEKENESTLPIREMEEMTLLQQTNQELHYGEDKIWDLSIAEWKNLL